MTDYKVISFLVNLFYIPRLFFNYSSKSIDVALLYDDGRIYVLTGNENNII